MNFRKDINGLRAIAVIAVVLFHFNNSWLPGGFVGVDIFFVISGFLMTGIIFRGIKEESFSIAQFYTARATRIIPALTVLCLLLLVFGWLYLTPIENIAIGKHAASSVSFLSNFIYFKESGYFDAASHEKWLLHTWSLSTEWQFYIIYPLILVAMRKIISLKTMQSAVLLGAVISFVFCLVASYKWPISAYYLLPTRAWEMMLGGVAYLYPFATQEKNKKNLEWLGLFLIISSCFLISKENLWPGYLALFPALGAFFIIQAQRNNSLITNNIIFQKIGTWSYSIYLWHWPIVVFYFQFDLGYSVIYGLILSVIFGFLSFKYIELKKFRLRHIVAISLSSLFLTSTSYLYTKNSTYTYGKKIVQKAQENSYKSSLCLELEDYCMAYGKEKQADFILWGDSFAGSLSQYLASRGYNFVAFSTSGCPPIYGVRRLKTPGNETSCHKKINDLIFSKLKNQNRVNNLIFISRWSLYNYGIYEKGILRQGTPFLCYSSCIDFKKSDSLKSLKSGMEFTISRLNEKFNILIFKGGPELKNKGLYSNTWKWRETFYSEHIEYQKPTNDYIDFIARKYNLNTIDHAEYLFKNDKLITYDKGYLFLDDSHLTPYGWSYISKDVLPFINAMLNSDLHNMKKSLKNKQ